MGKKAVVLGGGGAKGAYEIGVMEALIELRFDYQIVTGTSVGSLNGALFAQKDLKLAKKMWLDIDTTRVLDIDDLSPEEINYKELGKLLVEKKGLSYRNLEKLLTEVISEEKIRAAGVDFGLVTVRYPLMQPVQLFVDQIEEGKLIDYLLASAACFPAMKKHEIDGEKYIDGGYYDNLPIDLAIARGAREIVAVDLEAVGVMRKEKRRPDVSVITVKSEWPLGPMLIFDREQAKRNMKQGYADTLKAFGKSEGKKFCFRLGETEKIFQRVYPYMEKRKEEIFCDANNALIHMAQMSADALYKKRFHSNRRLQREELYQAMCEGLMEIFEFDRFFPYTYHSMVKELIHSYETIDDAPAHILEEKIAEIGMTKKFIENIDSLTALIAKIDRKVIVKYLIRMLKQMQGGNNERGIFYLFFICIPLETTSAMFYLALTDRLRQSFAGRILLPGQ
jgi:hypothetical protein